MKRSLLTLALVLSWAGTAVGGEIVVAAAASLTDALREIASAYEKETGNKVIISFGATGNLAVQLEAGAPFDLFMAADMESVDRLNKKTLLIPETVTAYATGRIAIAIPAGQSKPSDISALAGPGISKIAIANPAHAPYGKAAREAMEKSGVWEKLKEKVVFSENVRQTLQYLETGSVDAAVISYSLCSSPKVHCSIVPGELHAAITHGMAVVSGTRDEKAARGFLDFIRGRRGRDILPKYGLEFPR